MVGREILNAGGNAADAAVATYFVMSATMPSTAGLGGGGVCIIHRGEEDKIASEVLDFLPRAAAGGLVAVPGSARGMAALAARYGKLPWAQLVAPAESIAQIGEAASRALAHDVSLAEKKLRADPQMAALFTRADGSMLSEGDNLRQTELAGVLGQLSPTERLASWPDTFQAIHETRNVLLRMHAELGAERAAWLDQHRDATSEDVAYHRTIDVLVMAAWLTVLEEVALVQYVEQTVAAGQTELNVTLAYKDPMGTVGAAQARVNDLSLLLTSPSATVY